MLTVVSRIYYTVAERTGHVKLQPRSSSGLDLFSIYDANVLGGALLGTGMALSGSCPGTLFAQMAGGVQTGFYALNGAVIGGILWTGYGSGAVASRRNAAGVQPQAVTVSKILGLSRSATLVLLEVAFVGIIAATTIYTPPFPGTKVSGVVGGLLIGLSQLLSIITRRSMVGISGSYEELGNLFWSTIKSGDGKASPKSMQNVIFALSAGLGALAAVKAFPSFAAATPFEVPPVLATIGGALMVIGARLAGGCTSGHGISGISLLSVSSIVTIASTFAAGSVVAKLVY